MIKKQSKNSAITLISLVITIIVLIILASVLIYLGLNNNGIFTRAKQAKEATNKQTATEIINLKITTAQMNKYAEEQRMPTLKELSLALSADNEIQYVTESTQIGSTKYEVGENPSSIFTKLEKYPYEFEINSSLQLASINGVKIATNNTTSATSENTMSGQEHFTGEYYFDGKPIYEKTVKIPFPNSTGNFTANHNIPNIDNIWFNINNCFAKYSIAPDATSPLTYAISNAFMGLWYVDKNNIGLYTQINRYSDGYLAYVTVNYTKTTDKATQGINIDTLTLN